MPHPKIYEQHGLGTDNLKKFFTAKPKNEKRDQLRDLIRTRIHDGIESGLRDHRVFWAIDLAYDTSFNQINPTLVRDIIRKGQTTDEVLDILKRWNVGVDDLVRETIDANGQKTVIFDVPAMFQVMIPLVKSYVTIRRAKLFNDRNLHPFFKYEPVKFTLFNRIVAEIVTDIVGGVSQAYGYPAVLKQAILQALQYGTCLMFPIEEWHSEKQLMLVDGKEQVVTAKEGLRYAMPHPTRYFIDKKHRPATINTDSGCEFGGYWSIESYGNIARNEQYWNKDSVTLGFASKIGTASEYRAYFQEVFPCSMGFPTKGTRGAGDNDREKRAEYYSTGDYDKATFLTNVFMKLNPKEWGMADYDYPTWMRFVIGDVDTIMWASPVCYSPMLYLGYDADDLRHRNAPMSLEVLWAQDHMGILMSQHIFSVRQNLTKAVFYDTDQVDGDDIKELQNLGQRKYSQVAFIPFSGRSSKVLGQDKPQSFFPLHFPIQDTGQIISLMVQMLSILERVLALSAQEIGQAATHEQTAEETRVIATNTNTRVTFTGSYVDDFMDAWKRQIYEAYRAYGDDNVVAQVSMGVPDSDKVLNKLGFEIQDQSGTTSNGQIKAIVKGRLSRLSIDAFISSREGVDRINGPAIAGAMSNLLQTAFSNPVTAEAIGAEQALDLLTEVAKLAGLPKEFKLVVAKGAGEAEKTKAVQEAIAQMGQQITASAVKAAEQSIGEPVIEQLQQTNEAIAAVDQKAEQATTAVAALIQKLEPLLAAVEAQQQPQLPPPGLPLNAPVEPQTTITG